MEHKYNYILMVRLKVKEEKIQEFIEESIGDAACSVKNDIQVVEDLILFKKTQVIRLNSHSAKFMTTKMHSKHTQLTNIFKIWAENTKDFYSAETEVSFCKPVYPTDNVKWGSARDDFSDHEYFSNSSLMVIAAPQYVKKENVQEFIDSITLDSIGSTNEEPGCRFDVYQNLNDPTELYLYEVYSNADAFEYHRGTPHIKKMARNSQGYV